MLRNPDFPGHQRALNLADRQTHLPVSDCNGCGHAIAWTRSQRTGKRYPCNVYPKQDEEFGFDGDVLRAGPWSVHTREQCQAIQDEQARAREDELVREEGAAALREFESLIRVVDRARGFAPRPALVLP